MKFNAVMLGYIILQLDFDVEHYFPSADQVYQVNVLADLQVDRTSLVIYLPLNPSNSELFAGFRIQVCLSLNHLKQVVQSSD